MTARRRRVRLKTATFERATRAVQDVSLRRFGIVSTVMALVLVAQAPASAQYGSVIVTRDVMIPVRDGKLMATDLYRPVANGGVVTSKLPVLLNRTPYARETLAASARYFAQRGYVVAVQSLRGRYTSQGSFLKVQPADATDGYDAIEWLARQPYANGKVGMWGQSFAAHSQAGAAQLKPPALAALLLNMGGLANGWDHGVRYRGTYEMGRQLTWAWTHLLADAKRPEVKALLEREKVETWYALQPMKRGLNPLSIEPTYEAWYLDFFEHADYDAFWKDRMVNWSEHYDETADIPMLHVGGWYDIFLAGTFQNFSELRRRNRTPQRLLVGPWTHSGNLRPFAGDVAFGAEAAIPDFQTAFHIRWFDHFLKGLGTGVESESPVRLFVMGLGDGHKDTDGRLFHGGTWRDYPSWPVPGTRLVNYYFHGNGALSPVKPAAASSSTTYTFDPAHPVPTIGGDRQPASRMEPMTSARTHASRRRPRRSCHSEPGATWWSSRRSR
ncbi:MAG: CocE/NonD family hydrolase [Acidobacteria bacterium]|nr:CocE/NonD family hydrolase [Acidobacteriota bacterium]